MWNSCDLPLRDDDGYLHWPVLPAWEHEWIYTPRNKAQAVYFFVADVGAFCPDYQDVAGYRHFYSATHIDTDICLSARVCLPHCVPLRVSNVMVIRQYYNDQHRALSLKLTAVKFRRFLNS